MRAREMNEEKLVLAVEEFRCLYDWNHRHYSDLSIKRDAWIKISSLMGCSVVKCRKKWDNLRDKYRRERKKEIEAESGAQQSRRPTWALLSTMSFLRPFTKSKKSTSNLDVSEGQSKPQVLSSTDSGFFDASGETVLTPVFTADDYREETAERSMNSTSHSPNESTDNSHTFTLPRKAKKRKRAANEDDYSPPVTEPILSNKADSDELFLLSLHADLTSLPLQKKCEFKARALNLMNELLLSD